MEQMELNLTEQHETETDEFVDVKLDDTSFQLDDVVFILETEPSVS